MDDIVKKDSVLGEIVITTEQVDIVKATLFKGASDDELKLLFFECKRRGVHPLDRLIHPVVRVDKEGVRRVTFQTSIDLFRSEGESTGEYAGQDEITYGDEISIEGTEIMAPEWATASIHRRMENGEIITVKATARWKEYYPGEKLGHMWRKMPYGQLGKCAEALCWRKTFPRKLAGLYTFEELVLTDIVDQGKKLKEPQRKSTLKELKNGEPELTVKEKLHQSLVDYCALVGEDVYDSVLKEVSTFKDKSGKEVWITDVQKASDQWAGASLARLREKMKGVTGE
jgi:phage recombination protein Bet